MKRIFFIIEIVFQCFQRLFDSPPIAKIIQLDPNYISKRVPLKQRKRKTRNVNRKTRMVGRGRIAWVEMYIQ